MHIVDLSHAMQSQIPGAVLRLLGKSIKFIPQSRPNNFHHLAAQVRGLGDRLRWRERLRQAPSVPKAVKSGGKRPPRCSPEIEDAILAHQSAVIFELENSWPQIVKNAYVANAQNFSSQDRAALRWLRENSDQYVAVETDKNLGVALASSSWVERQVRKHLANSYAPADSSAVLCRLNDALLYVNELVDEAQRARTISKGNARFLVQNHIGCHNALMLQVPRFRVNIKVHKDPIGSRPLVNARSCWIQ